MTRAQELLGDQSILSRREREIMDLLFRLGPSTISKIRCAMLDPPTYSGVRALLRILWIKGHVTYDQRGKGYVYRTVESGKKAGEKVLVHIIETYFQGSPCSLVATLIDMPQAQFSHDNLLHLRRLIEKRIADANHT